MKRIATAIFLSAFLLLCSTARSQDLGEMRGAWLATVAGLDWPDAEDGAIVQQLKLLEQIKGLRELGCNTIIFQVVSNMDAIYPSSILPWSAVLTGTEGKDPGYDPVDLAVKAAHECGMKIHLWINPMRASRRDRDLHCAAHVSRKHPEWIQTYNHQLYLDPGIPEVVDFIVSVASEIMTCYDADGLHIDDYFYPDGLQKSSRGWKDTSYRRYGKGLTRDEWRYGTVDRLVARLHNATHASRPTAVFGVSPSGRLVNTMRLYADPRNWVEEGSVDYLAPQIYWTVERDDEAAFDVVLDSWKFIAKGVPVYVGIAAYKHSPGYAKGKDAAFSSLGEFRRQIDLCRNSWYVSGHIWFRTEDILGQDFKAYILSEIY